MQTFLPYPDFLKSLMVLDYRRLGKQRVEAKQLLKGLVALGVATPDHVHMENLLVQTEFQENWEKIVGKTSGWVNHPASKMWVKNPGALAVYHDVSLLAWTARGYNNGMLPVSIPGRHKLPDWFGSEEFHASHRSNLLRKAPEWYSNFGWTEPHDLEYIWP